MKPIHERSLIIKKEWLDLILAGKKPWEMRSTKTNIRGWINLIESGSGLIIAETNLVDCLPPINKHKDLFKFHRVEDLSLLEKWCYPWVLKDAKRYDKPIPYDHPQGAVIWVKHKTT